MVEQSFLAYIKKMMHLKEATDLMFWDMRTGAPKKGAALRSEAVGTITSMIYEMSTSSKMKEYIDTLSEHSLSPVTQRILEEVKKEYDYNTQIPVGEYKEYVILKSMATTMWEEAKKQSDFSIFQPSLEKLVQFKKRFTYDELLQIYDPGVSVALLDRVTTQLKQSLFPLLEKIQAKSQPNRSFFVPKDKQKLLFQHVLEEIGYDFESGRLDESVHPFAIALNRHDVRVTTLYDEQDVTTGLYGAIHEGGHALYEQNISPSLIGTPLCEGASWGMHESQSLFWEKMIGLHPGFCERVYTFLKKLEGNALDGVAFQDFYRALHVVKPSYIRVDADELTYPIHVMIRYEIEKGLLQDEIEVKELPHIWNQKMKDYLGIEPPSDRQGVLQDIHWSLGYFGQFPSYMLGYLYAAQFRQAMRRDLSDFDSLISRGDFAPIRAWLRDHIHCHGKMKKPDELLVDATGEALNPDHLIRYFTEKYTKIYNL